ncbi:MAG: MerR family transcriptional regulator [Bacteroidota bacterium]
MYSISELERLSGIKAHTIRVWERRYSLLKPQRTDTNIRYYDNEQLVRLLNVATLLEKKWKISKISALSDQQIKLEIERILATTPREYGIQINGLFRQCLEYDEMGFEKTLSYNFLRKGIRDTLVHIIYPFLQKVGAMWRIDGINPAQEHFASNLIRRKLCTAIDGLAPPDPQKPAFLLFLAENEHHELGLIVADYLLRYSGFKTIYLGANVPYTNLLQARDLVRADYLMTAFTTPREQDQITSYVQGLERDFPDTKIITAGAQMNEQIKSKLDRVIYLPSLSALEAFIRLL